MPRSKSRRSPGRGIAIAVTVVGTALLVVGGYLVLTQKDSDKTPKAEQPVVALQPNQVEAGEVPESFEDLVDPSKFDDGSSAVTGSSDPLKNATGDTSMHDVVITIRSSGPMKYLVRTREGNTGPAAANQTATLTKRLRGPLPVTQVFVQLLGTTSATCTVSIDGVQKSTATVKKQYGITVCTA